MSRGGSSKSFVMIVAGTRPETVKVAPVIWELDRLGVEYIFVWTGQHYDYEMGRLFFEQLRLPEPMIYLESGRVSHHVSESVAIMVKELTHLIEEYDPTIVYALGDTNTTLSAALASVYAGKPFVHDEAGMRSFDSAMLEEINRRIADTVANFRLAPTNIAVLNLLCEGFPLSSIRLVGSTAVDTLLYVLNRGLLKSDIVNELSLEPQHYVLVTVHRRENLIDVRLTKIASILTNIAKALPEYKVVFPVHPHTKKRLSELGIISIPREYKNILLLEPLGYLEFVALVKDAGLIITDSGGVQEEAFVLGKKTLTLRKTTEWPESVVLGYSYLVDVDRVEVSNVLKLVQALMQLHREAPHDFSTFPLGDGRAGWRVARILKTLIETKAIKRGLEIPNPNPYPAPTLIEFTGDALHHYITLCFEGKVPAVSFEELSARDIRCVARESGLSAEIFNKLIKVDWSKVDQSIERIFGV